MTTTEIDTIAPQMDRAARELAHSDGDDTPEAFARGHVLAVAECCGALAADQCADGEEWEPAGWLEGDRDAVLDAMLLVMLLVGLGERPGAYDAQGLARR